VRLALLLLLAAGCAHKQIPGPFHVAGAASSKDAEQAMALAEAGVRLYPDSALRFGGEIYLAPDIDACCGFKTPEPDGVLHYAGCVYNRICVLWPHPKLPPDADLTRSALPHEMGHIVLPLCSEAQAEEIGRKIVEDYKAHIFDGLRFK